MKNSSLLVVVVLFTGSFLSAQVKIGENPQTIDPSSVLELESTDKVLVITRVTTVQMNLITPRQGALCYNTDLNAVHYYNGNEWVNIGSSDATDAVLTANGTEGNPPTIDITPTAEGSNFEVAQNSLNTFHIIDGSINGVDIQGGSISGDKLQYQSITSSNLAENSVGAFALNAAEIPVSDFENDAGYLNLSTEPGNVLQGIDGGVYYNNQPLLNQIDINTNSIANNPDKDAANELQDLSFDSSSGILTISTPKTAGNQVDLGSLNGGSGTDDQKIESVTLNASNQLTIAIEDGGAKSVDLNVLAADGAETKISGSETIAVDGTGTSANPYELTAVLSDGAIANSKLAPGAANQILRTAADGITVDWVDLPAAAAIEVDDTLTGDGSATMKLGLAVDAVTTDKIKDGNVTNSKLAPGAANKILRTAADGLTVDWVDLPTSGAVITNTTLTGDGSSAATELGLADNAVTSAKIFDGAITKTKLAPGASNQILRTNAAGDAVDWVALPTAAAIEVDDTLTGDGSATMKLGLAVDAVTTDKIKDENVTNSKLAPGAANQILRTAADGLTVDWVDLPTGAAVITNTTLTGDGSSATTELGLADNAVTSAKIFDGAITKTKLAPGASNQILRTNAAGDAVDWVNLPTGGAVITNTTLTGDGSSATTELGLADNAVTSAKIFDGAITKTKLAPGASNQILRTNAAGDAVDWVNLPTGGAVITNTTLTGDGSSATTELGLADNAVTSAKIFDGAVTKTKLAPGASNQILRTNAAGDAVEWVALPDTDDLADGKLLIGGTDGKSKEVVVSGDATIDNLGALAIVANAVTTDKIKNATILAEDLNAMGATTAGDRLAWNTTLNSADGGWEVVAAAATGEVNTTSNGGVTGTGSIGLVLPKDNLDFPFKNINAGDSGILSVTDDAANKEIDIDIKPATLAANDPTQVLTTDKDTGEVKWAPLVEHKGTAKNIFFAGPDGFPVDTQSNLNTRDNGGMFWDPTKRFDTGALYLGLKLNNNGSGPDSSIESSVEGYSKLIVAERLPVMFGGLALPIQLRNETNDDGAATGLLFSVNKNGDSGKGALVFERGTTESEGAFHFLIRGATDADAPKLADDKVFTVKNNGDVLITGQLGIGTTTPDRKLDVAGEAKAESFASAGGTVGQPAYSFYTGTDTDTGMYRPAADEIGFSVGGVEALKIEEDTGKTKVTIKGSLFTNIRKDNTAAVAIAADDYTVILTSATSVTLPMAAANEGRVLILKNATNLDIAIAGYIPSNASNSLIAGSVLQLQSDGSDWYQIN